MLMKTLSQKTDSRGDTLVEVLFATATASLVIVLALVVMNRNLAQIQMNVEITFVRHAMDSQAEVLRYLRGEYAVDPTDPDPAGAPKQWRDLIDTSASGYAQDKATKFGICQPTGGAVTAPAANNAFYINNSSDGASSDQAETDAADIQNIVLKKIDDDSVPQTYARPGQGLWVESVNRTDFGTRRERYVDFHIRACWEPPFSGPQATLGTIVRLYYEIP